MLQGPQAKPFAQGVDEGRVDDLANLAIGAPLGALNADGHVVIGGLAVDA
jgi:hypothetical protein